MRRYGWWLFWSLAALLLFFGNGQLWITDSVESNYALTAKEMVLSGDWISPQIYGNYWYDKPIFFYWLTAAGFKIFGFNEFAARFFPALFGMAGLGLLVYAAKKLYGEKTAFWSGAVLLTSVEFFLISKSVITDSTLFFFFSMALVFFYLGYSTQQKNYYYGMYTGMALATLTKGPIGFLLPGLIMVLFLGFTRGWREIKNMKVFSGGLLFFLIAAPWYVAMYNLHGSAFIDQFFGTHNFLRATVSEHPRDNVFYYYTLVLLLALFPWSGLLPRFLWHTLREDGKWRRPDEKTGFLLIWAATVFFFFQNMATKYLTYTYPMLFPLALLLGKYLSEKKWNAVTAGTLIVRDLIYIALFGGALWCWWNSIISIGTVILIGAAVLAVIGISWISISLENGLTAAGVIAVTALAFNLLLINEVAVPFSSLRSDKEIGLELAQSYRAVDEIGVYGKYSTSAVFYSGKKIIKLVPDEDLVNFAPKAYSWKVKNVMPFEGVNSFGRRGQLLLVKKNEAGKFLNGSNGKWLVTGEKGGWYILKSA